MTEMLLRRLPTKVLIQLITGPMTMTDLMRAMEAKFYPSVNEAIGRLENKGLVESKKEGSNRFISLTEKGRKIAEELKEIEKLLTAE